LVENTSPHSVNYPHHYQSEMEGYNMDGGIYSRQKCRECGGSFVDNGKSFLYCPKHHKQKATTFFVRFPGDVFKNFRSYDGARRFLNSCQVRVDQDDFDPRDYKKDNPLGFTTLAEEYIRLKEDELDSPRTVRYHMGLAIEFWKDRNIKTIRYAQLEDFLLCKTDEAKALIGHLKGKSRANLKATLHAFWVKLIDREVLRPEQMPKFPTVPYSFKRRKLIDKPTQLAVLEQIRKATERNPKIHLAVSLLKTYFCRAPHGRVD